MTEIHLEGIHGKERDQIEAEIKDVLTKFSHYTEKLLKRVIVTQNFNEAVMKLLEESSWEKTGYEQEHEYGFACAKTIPEFQSGETCFNLILDKMLFGRLDAVGRLDRLGLFIHEHTHMVDEKLRFDSIGEDGFRRSIDRSVPRSRQEMLFENGWIIWQEYHAERTVFEAYEAVGDSKVKFDYAPKVGHLESLKKLLSGLSEFLKENILKFRLWQLTGQMIERVISERVESILYLYAYVFALCDAVGRYEDRLTELRDLDGYRFFSEDLPHIRSIFQELYEKRERYSPELIHQIGSSIDSILKKCGLEVRSTPEGPYLEVHDI